MILMFLGGKCHDLCDDIYKASYLPFHEAEPFYDLGEKALVAVMNGPLGPFARLIASVKAGHRGEARLDRRVAALRVVEALRLHAGATGRWPNSLGDVKVVPIPHDPTSGQPFEYRLDGDAATLTALIPKGQERLGLTYRITLSK